MAFPSEARLHEGHALILSRRGKRESYQIVYRVTEFARLRLHPTSAACSKESNDNSQDKGDGEEGENSLKFLVETLRTALRWLLDAQSPFFSIRKPPEPLSEEKRRLWAAIMADAIDEGLLRCKSGIASQFSFIGTISEFNQGIDNGRNIFDDDLRAVWYFAEAYFDELSVGRSTMEGIPWPEATQKLRESAIRLRAGDPIVDPDVLPYGY